MAVDMIYQESLAATIREQVSNGLRRLLVTSDASGQGTSHVAAELGRALALWGRESAVVVDANSFHPSLHEIFGVPDRRGLGDLIEETYWADLTRESPAQFGPGDWLEILRAQLGTGELLVTGDDQSFTLRLTKGSIHSISGPHAAEELRVGDILVRRRHLTPRQREEALLLQQTTGRPLGDILERLGSITASELAEALEYQTSQRLVKLISLRDPECRFSELAEPYLPAAGGRTAVAPDGGRIDRLVSERLRDYLKDPFLSSQVPAYLSDTALPSLKVLTAGTRPCDLLERRYLRPFGLLMNRLARLFDVVLIDSPPVSLASPTSALAGSADGVLLVVSAEGTVQGIRKAAEDLRRAGGNVLGVVLNEVEVSGQQVGAP